MPYKSEQQRKFFNANREELEKKGVNVDEFNKASEGMKLPKRVGEKKQHIYTIEEIKKMSNSEYTKNEKEIMRQMKEKLIK